MWLGLLFLWDWLLLGAGLPLLGFLRPFLRGRLPPLGMCLPFLRCVLPILRGLPTWAGNRLRHFHIRRIRMARRCRPGLPRLLFGLPRALPRGTLGGGRLLISCGRRVVYIANERTDFAQLLGIHNLFIHKFSLKSI